MTIEPKFAKKPVSVHVEARRWLQRSYGNTYHSVRVVVEYGDGTEQELIAPFEYGYGDHWTHTAAVLMIKAGLFDVEANDPVEIKAAAYGVSIFTSQKSWWKEQGVNYFASVTDVPRKRDLHNQGKKV